MMDSEGSNQRNGSCHCGAVRFTVALEPELQGRRCNCSICSMKGVVMIAASATALTVTSGEDALSCYSFNTGAAKHWFCSRCGIHCFHQTRIDPGQYGVNAACLEGISPYDDFPDLPVADGMNHPKDGNPSRLAGRLRFEPARRT